MQWIDDYNTGIIKIDMQHRSLCNLVDELDVEGFISKEKVLLILSNISGLIVEHFNYEELLMVEVGYPYFQQHAEEHVREIQKLHDIISSYTVRGTYTVDEIFNTLKMWIVVHSIFDDKDFSNYYIEAKNRKKRQEI